MRDTWYRPRRVAAALLRWACLSLCYVAFTGTLSKAEGIAAALTGAFAAVLSLGLRALGERRLSLRGRWAAALARTAWLLVRDTGRVGATLVAAIVRGHRGEVVLDREPAAHALGAGSGRRAVTALLASLTPDSMALETGDRAIRVHRLAKSSESARPRSSGR